MMSLVESKVDVRETAVASMCELFQNAVVRFPERVALRTLGGTRSITWREYGDAVKTLAAGFAGLGVKHGDSVAFLLTNRPEFHLVDTAANHLGATCVSIYSTQPAADVAWTADDAGARILVTERSFLTVALASQAASKGIEQIVLVDGSEPGTLSLEELAALVPETFDFESSWKAVTADDVLMLIYTSGTTGLPKGAEMTHGGVLLALDSWFSRMPTWDQGDIISFLPMAHAAERLVIYYQSMRSGLTITCCPDSREVAKYLLEVRPRFFWSPPRMYQKFQAAVEGMIAAEPDEAKRHAILDAIEIGRRKVEAERDVHTQIPEAMQREFASVQETLLRPILASLGLDNCDFALTGGANIAAETVIFWRSLGLPLLQGWGMTECCAFGAFPAPDKVKVDSIGPAAPGATLKLAEDGEILLLTPFAMRGYRNRPEASAEAFDEDGYIRTGDVGVIDEDGYLKIIDRKKDLIIGAGAKNMSPASIEDKLINAGPLISQAVAIGNDRPYNVALLTLDSAAVRVWASAAGSGESEVPSANAELVAAVRAEVDVANERMARVEQIKRFIVLDKEWTPGSDEMTPTMKLKRRVIDEKYRERLDALYNE